MRLLARFLACAVLLVAADPMYVELPLEDRVALLEIQRQQFRSHAIREEARAAMYSSAEGLRFLSADAALQQANAAFVAKQQELRSKHNCLGCDIRGDELRLYRPIPDTVVVTPLQPGVDVP